MATLQVQVAPVALISAVAANDAAVIHSRGCRGLDAFHAFYKVVGGAGRGLPLPGLAHQIPAAPPAPIGSVVPQALWPPNYDTLRTWDAGCIDSLSRFLNDDFGILQGDDERVCRHKLYMYLLQLPSTMAL